MKKSFLYPALILLLFLAVGLFVVKDYGPSADEHIQIDSGHVIWKYLCQKFGWEIPEPLRDTPELHGFKNSYYGQAATFPTVLLEAVRGFRLDSSTIIRVRHYWNFLSYFAGLCCFALMVTHLTGSGIWAALWLLLQILLPRIFGDIFYNDRDVMLISWMMIFLSAFYLFIRRPGWGTALLSAAAFGIMVNTRIFGLSLLVFPGLYFLFSPRRKYILLFAAAFLAVWFVTSPIAWDDPLHAIPDAFLHFSTQQRFIDMGGKASLRFFGESYPETELPWYYIPMYIVVTTPAATLICALAGCVSSAGLILRKRRDARTLLDTGMMILLVAVPAIAVIFRLTIYNGWRHFYFLFLPITWLALEGIMFLWDSRKWFIRIPAVLMLCVSFFLSASWIAKVHPYQIIYLSPLFREKWIGKFDRDYWVLSTTELMKYLMDYAPETTLNAVDKYAFIDYTYIGLPPQERERFHAIYHGMQPTPYEYLFFNYSNALGNEAKYDFYMPIYAVERDGIKLGELFRRSHNNELPAAAVTESITADVNTEDAGSIADGDYGTGWYGADRGELMFRLNDVYDLYGFEVFPIHGAEGFRDPSVYRSDDGSNWTKIEITPAGSNGYKFDLIRTRWLKLVSSAEHQGISEMLFYGTAAGE